MRTITIEPTVLSSGNTQYTILIDGAKTQVGWSPEIIADQQTCHQIDMHAEIMCAVLKELQSGFSLSEEERKELARLMSTTKE